MFSSDVSHVFFSQSERLQQTRTTFNRWQRDNTFSRSVICTLQFGQLGIGSNSDTNVPTQVVGFGASPVKLLSCGWRHTFAVTEGGEVFSWGRGVNGQLGHDEPKDTCVPSSLTHSFMSPDTVICASTAVTRSS